MKIGIVGSGKFGRVLAQIAGDNGHDVLIFSRRDAEVNSINTEKKSTSGFEFHSKSNITATTNPGDLSSVTYVLFSISSRDFRKVMDSIKPYIKNQICVSCIKGFQERSGKLVTDILSSDYGIPDERLVVLSGPNLSKELGNYELTGTVLAGKNKKTLIKLGEALSNEYFVPYYSMDLNGVEMGGALKNIYAIVSGYFHQKGVGENTIGLLLTKCLEEMRIFSEAKGANPATFLGLSGVGDFFSTALSKDSRNYIFGTFLAQDFSVNESLNKVNDTVEGYLTSIIVHKEAKRIGLKLKILDFLISLYSSPKSLDDAKNIFRSKMIQKDIELEG